MRFLRLYVFSIWFLTGIPSVFAQTGNLSPSAEISLITCGPGEDLYATFGHSAIHISDSQKGIDRVYNYGTFDFNTPNFYLKFARGKLNYMLSVSTLDRFLRVYQFEQRWVYRQKINLTADEKARLYAYLENNARPENRDYKYDFFYDNCSTRLRDALEEVLGEKLIYPDNTQPEKMSFREMIDLYLTRHPWSDLGIDLALGLPCDREASWRQQMFLPDYLMKNLSDVGIKNSNGIEPLLGKGIYILAPAEQIKTEPHGIMWIFWTLFIVSGVSAVFVKARYFRWFDVILFAIAGLLGIFIVLLWFATDHSATKWNFNLLWALPTWLWGAVLLIRGTPSGKFFKIHAAIMFAILIFWIAIPQDFHQAVVPLTLALMMRSWAWQKRNLFAIKPR